MALLGVEGFWFQAEGNRMSDAGNSVIIQLFFKLCQAQWQGLAEQIFEV